MVIEEDPGQSDQLQFIRSKQEAPSKLAKKWSTSTVSEVRVGSASRPKRETTTAIESKSFPTFEKEVASLQEAKQQETVWRSLRDRGIPTYEMFKIATRQTSAGENKYYVVTEDLMKDGECYVLSRNNVRQNKEDAAPEHHVFGPSVLFDFAMDMPREKREELRGTIKEIAQMAAEPDGQGRVINLQQYETGHSDTHPYMLVVNKNNLGDARVIIGDLGSEDIKMDTDVEKAQKANTERAEKFITEMLIRN